MHLLHPGHVRVGRSADADVPLDDPDVSRLHCELTVGGDGRVTVADPGSTNGTALEGRPVGPRPVPLSPGALLRIGESALRLSAGADAAPLPTAPDGEGRVRVVRPAAAPAEGGAGTDGRTGPYASAAGRSGAASPAGTGRRSR
ncbi:FHA domain-containing protein [Streptomyces somaliensis]|uniref:FHA domain-containing protein n=1 Tax=Streptomyces somaliensis TaxID=78355 RepID=UPI0028160292|nr:FHA domain-containing protein [Streptomyces somaliensis]